MLSYGDTTDLTDLTSCGWLTWNFNKTHLARTGHDQLFSSEEGENEDNFMTLMLVPFKPQLTANVGRWPS